MKEHMEITRDQGPSSTKLFAQVTIGHQCKQMPRPTSKHVINVNASAAYLDNC